MGRTRHVSTNQILCTVAHVMWSPSRIVVTHVVFVGSDRSRVLLDRQELISSFCLNGSTVLGYLFQD